MRQKTSIKPKYTIVRLNPVYTTSCKQLHNQSEHVIHGHNTLYNTVEPLLCDTTINPIQPGGNLPSGSMTVNNVFNIEVKAAKLFDFT